MKQYLDIFNHVKTERTEKRDRNGNGNITVYENQMRINLENGNQ